MENKLGSTSLIRFSLPAFFSSIVFLYDPLAKLDNPVLAFTITPSGFRSLESGVVGGKAVDLTTFEDFLIGKLLELIELLVKEVIVVLVEGGIEVVLDDGNERVLLGRVRNLDRGVLRVRFGSNSLSSSLS